MLISTITIVKPGVLTTQDVSKGERSRSNTLLQNLDVSSLLAECLARATDGVRDAGDAT